MWFADVGVALSLVLLVGLVSAAVLVPLARRAGWAVPSVRRRVWTGAVSAAVLLLGQAVVVDSVADRVEGSPGGLSALDHPVLDWFVAHRAGWASVLATALASLGGTVVMSVVAVLVSLWLLRLGRRREALVVALTCAGAALLVLGFKHLYDRDRPPLADQLIAQTNQSLPSGHALGSTVVLGVTAAVLVTRLAAPLARGVVLGVVAALVVVIGISRLYLGVHWLTDVVTGWLLGGAWLAVAVTVLVLPTGSRARRIPTG